MLCNLAGKFRYSVPLRIASCGIEIINIAQGLFRLARLGVVVSIRDGKVKRYDVEDRMGVVLTAIMKWRVVLWRVVGDKYVQSNSHHL
jgi:hypothetical protein